MKVKIQYRYNVKGVYTTNGAPGNDDNSPVTLGPGLWVARLWLDDGRNGGDGTTLHTDALRVKQKGRYVVKKNGERYKIVGA